MESQGRYRICATMPNGRLVLVAEAFDNYADADKRKTEYENDALWGSCLYCVVYEDAQRIISFV